MHENLPLSLAAYERACVERAVREAKGDAAAAARLLGIGKSTMYRYLSRYRTQMVAVPAPVPGGMVNRRMAEMLDRGEAIAVDDVGEKLENGYWKIPTFVEGRDYCVRSTEQWIWSIARHGRTGAIHASTTSDLYQRPGYLCLFLR